MFFQILQKNFDSTFRSVLCMYLDTNLLNHSNLAIWLQLFKQRKCNLNQSKDDSFVERVAKNNSWNNGDRHNIHEILLINCFVFVITLDWKRVHSSTMTQIKAHLMEKKHCNLLFPDNSTCFSWLNKGTVWPLRYLETFSLRSPRKKWIFNSVERKPLVYINISSIARVYTADTSIENSDLVLFVFHCNSDKVSRVTLSHAIL